MKQVLLVVFLACTLAACSEHPSRLLETARFEEKQGNRPHAIQLYEDIVAKSPASPEAKIAQERLKELKGVK